MSGAFDHAVTVLAGAVQHAHPRAYPDVDDALPGASDTDAANAEVRVLSEWLGELCAEDTLALDVGTGAGRLLPLLRAGGVCAFDPDPRRLSRAQRFASDRMALFRLGVSDVPWSQLAGQFDVVVCSHVLGHLPRRSVDRVVPQLARALTPGGAIVLALPMNTGDADLFIASARDGFDHVIDAATFDELASNDVEQLPSRHMCRASLDALAADAALLVDRYEVTTTIDARRINAAAVLRPIARRFRA